MALSTVALARFYDDPVFVRERLHARWFIDNVMHGCDAGELALIIGLTICERWILEHKTSYGYELAWIFDRDRGTIRNALHYLEQGGEIERVDPIHRGRRIFYKPTSEAEASYLRPSQNDQMNEWAMTLHESCPCTERLKYEN